MGEIPHPFVKLQNRRRRRCRESGLGGKLLVREGNNQTVVKALKCRLSVIKRVSQALDSWEVSLEAANL